ncbi:MAG: hypothetical protein DRP54_02870 [Spirochaetes bacterium]|nr:MAG: hypothetical protein DRP54_02870 [Spirochaetota bacterium]
MDIQSLKKAILSKTSLQVCEIIPLPDLEKALLWTLESFEKGYIPKSYSWSVEKTRKAYRYEYLQGWQKSVIVAAISYYTGEVFPEEEEFGKISMYTWRNNYSFIKNELRKATEIVEETTGKKLRSITLSNYTSIPEKVLFRASSLADIGKNTLLLRKDDMGSYFVVGEAIIDLDIESFGTEPRAEHQELTEPDFSICGDCRRCIEACPTDALETGRININLCFQYISENLLLIPRELREKWGNRLYGCSICLDVCPYNKNLKPIGIRHDNGVIGGNFNHFELLKMSEEKFHQVFGNNQIGMRSLLAIKKNSILSLGYLAYKKALPILSELINHQNEIIRAYSAWAIGRIGGKKAKKILESRYRIEKNPTVKKEIEDILD